METRGVLTEAPLFIADLFNLIHLKTKNGLFLCNTSVAYTQQHLYLNENPAALLQFISFLS